MSSPGLAEGVKSVTDSVAQSEVWNFFSTFLSDPPPHQGTVEYADTFHELFLAMTIASILGALLAYHPKRAHELNSEVSDAVVKKTQILICVAGSIIFPLIRGDLALAFGLAGFGGFVRYRTALSNPMDLSMIFILIGLGMACGLQYYSIALAITGFIYLLLYIMDIPNGSRLAKWDIRVDSTNPKIVHDACIKIFREREYHVERKRINNERGRFRCIFIAKNIFNTDEFGKQLHESCGPDITIHNIDWAKRK
ncbi:MAG: DUF4956 domain-containing protein [Candidatus Hinthialibacter antarcticus]|nr:DUF4956 domain-containing protein [Candidatus Hinthialibacter antarcticus]